MKTEKELSLELKAENLFKQYHEKCNGHLLSLIGTTNFLMLVISVFFFGLYIIYNERGFQIVTLTIVSCVLFDSLIKLSFYFPYVRRLLNLLSQKLEEIKDEFRKLKNEQNK